ncbi:MAG: hypothetical protein PVI09_11645, partial [Anaerolineae bacterium]
MGRTLANNRVSAPTKLLRFSAGLVLVVGLLAFAFALLPGWIHTWGATDEEVARTMPGDEFLDSPTLTWTHGITIRAHPSEVWPWIAQIGDERAGFYSYTFIENLIAQEDLYENANRIIPEFQNPQPGQGLILDYLTVHSVEPGQYLLAQLANVPDLGWTWIWHLYPSAENETRLVVRTKIQPGEELNNPLIAYVMDVGGFVMERRMMQGIKDRAEGNLEPESIEVIEIALWLLALAAGLAGAVLFVRKSAWPLPLLVATGAVLALLVFTFLQPPIWIRVVVDAALLGGLAVFVLANRLIPADRLQ